MNQLLSPHQITFLKYAGGMAYMGERVAVYKINGRGDNHYLIAEKISGEFIADTVISISEYQKIRFEIVEDFEFSSYMLSRCKTDQCHCPLCIKKLIDY